MKVIETLEAQINKAGKNTPAAAVGYMLILLCKSSPSIAQLVGQDLANDSMDIGHCYRKLYDHATKHKRGNEYVMPPQEAERIVKEFYGIPMDQQAETASYTASTSSTVPNNVISLDDLLSGL